MYRVIGVLVLQLVYLSSFANTILHGTVKSDRGEPIIGASVTVEGSFMGTATNADGRFTLKLKAGDYVLRVSHVGYRTTFPEVTVEGETTVDITLERSSYMAEEVIVSATRAHSRVPVAYTDISRAEIEGRDYGQDIPYIISLTPSFVASSDAGTGIGYTSFRIRGSDMNRINITLNGIPLNDSESHGVWWVNMPDLASSLDNVQIQRGVGTSTHGAGAFGASINLQTSVMQQDAYGEITSSAGSFNTFRNTVKVGSGLINDRFTFDARLSKINSDGFIERSGSDLKSFFISGGMHNEKSILKVNVFSGQEKTSLAWTGVPSEMLGDNRRYNSLGRFTNLDGETDYYDNETDNYQQDHYQLFYSRELSRNLNLNTAFHYTRGYGYFEQYRPNDRFRSYGLGNLEMGDDVIDRSDLVRRRILDNHFYGMTFSVKYSQRKYDITFGGGMNRYDGDHYGHIIWAQFSGHIPKDYEWYFNNGDKTDLNFFGKIDYRLTDRLNLYGDLQYRRIDYSIDGIDSRLRDITSNHDYGFFNPKAGIFFELDDRQNVYLSYAVAHREPSRSNFTDARPGEFPRPERLDNIETGYNFRSENLSLNANLFYMKYTDQLVLTGDINDVGKDIMTNAPDSYRAGIELMAGARLSSVFELSFNVSVSENRISDFTEYIDNWDYWDDPENEPLQVVRHIGSTELSFSPPVVAGGDLTIRPVENLAVNLAGKYVGRQFIDNTASRDRMLNSYFFSDLRINYTIETSRYGEFGINFMAANIFDAKFETNAWIYRYLYQGEERFFDGFFPQAGRHFFTGVFFKF
ncbi:MAG: TonB-dependent receptor [Marinilabiliales bacterium]|nr:MAG: TonB-dependent receptor [Marinilabiliales bacterium]